MPDLYVPATQQEWKPFENKDEEGKIHDVSIMGLGVRKTSFSILSFQ